MEDRMQMGFEQKKEINEILSTRRQRNRKRKQWRNTTNMLTKCSSRRERKNMMGQVETSEWKGVTDRGKRRHFDVHKCEANKQLED